MSNKQFRITSESINPLFNRSTVGFDHLVESLFGDSTCTTGYPPYNITRITNAGELDKYAIVLALAGFTEDDISIEVENNTLLITGNSDALGNEDSSVEYLHKGIAARKFTRSFRLSDDVEIEGASLKNGILTVTLVRVIPEKVSPKLIKITTL